jgi:hypothetical protein
MSEDFVLDIVKRIAPDLTEQQATAAAERARAKAMESGGGIAQLFTDSKTSAEIVIKEAVSETMAKLKAKGETEITASELARLEKQRLCFGKAGADKPLLHRGNYIKTYGQADYDAAMKIWSASATNLTPKSNPYTKKVRKAMRAARTGTLENTEFNQVFHANEIKQPKSPKPEKVRLTPGKLNLTELGKLYKSDPASARAIAAQSGIKLP